MRPTLKSVLMGAVAALFVVIFGLSTLSVVSNASASRTEKQLTMAAQDGGANVSADLLDRVSAIARAAKKGDAQAQRRLGDMYANADGVGRDYDQAIKWYLKAAEQGNKDAQNALKAIYAWRR